MFGLVGLAVVTAAADWRQLSASEQSLSFKAKEKVVDGLEVAGSFPAPTAAPLPPFYRVCIG